ncbi:hypothetical protein ABIE28_001258 [Devosia sp. 2618]
MKAKSSHEPKTVFDRVIDCIDAVHKVTEVFTAIVTLGVWVVSLFN